MNTIVMVSFIIFITEWKSLSLSFQGFIAALTISLSSLQAKGNEITFFTSPSIIVFCLVHRSHFTRFALHYTTHSTDECPFLSVCEAKSVGLDRYPATVAPETGSVTVETHCADNAHSTLCMAIMCLPNGIWQDYDLAGQPIPPQCQCDEGYHEASVDGRMICQGEICLCYTIPCTAFFQLP